MLVLVNLLPGINTLTAVVPAPILNKTVLIVFTVVDIRKVEVLFSISFGSRRGVLVITISVKLKLNISICPKVFRTLPGALRLFLKGKVIITDLYSILLGLVFGNGGNLSGRWLVSGGEAFTWGVMGILFRYSSGYFSAANYNGVILWV